MLELAQVVSTRERDRIDRFIASYNVIDKHLRCLLRQEKSTFKVMVKECVRLGRVSALESEVLMKFAGLRNALVHEPLQAKRYLAAPTVNTVQQFESLRDHLLKPELVLPKYKKEVEIVSMDDSLTMVLGIISQRDYSQFPVYDDHTFKGLLTENLG